MRVRPGVIAALIAAAAAAPGTLQARPGGGHHGGHHDGRGPVHAVPGLTPQGRFVHGPAFGHPPILGRAVHPFPRGRRFLVAPFVAPVVVPGYPYDYLPPQSLAALPPEEYVPPPVAYAPPPAIPGYAPPPAPPAVAVPPPPAAPIYYCAELHAYTNDLASMACPGPWKRMTP